jgi:hypothetical protein
MEVFMAKEAKEFRPEAEAPGDVGPLLDGPAEVNARSEPQGRSVQVHSGTTFGERLGRFLRFVVRLLALVVILSILLMGLYLGLPWLYQKYVVPVEQNTAQMRELHSRQEQTGQQLTDLQTRLETLETMQNQHDQSLTDMDQRVVELEAAVAERTKSLAALEDMQSELQAQNESASVELERQFNLLKAMELLSRARLFLYQSNFGLARQDVQIARDLLTTVQPDAPQKLGEELAEVVVRLDMTLLNLPNFPVAASDNLDIAWQVLLSGLPETAPTVTPSPTQAGPASPTPGGGTVTSTPIPGATVRPSATP